MLISSPFRPAADTDTLYKDLNPWLVPGIIPAAGLVVLASAPKTGKTCLATAIARAVATGAPFLGEPVTQGPVLWCAHEETPRERLPLHEGLTDEDPFLIAYPGEMPALDKRLPKTDRHGRRDLRDHDLPFVFKHAAKVNARLIVIDCLHAAVEGACLADNSIARAVMGTLRVWSAHMHVSVLVLHHLTKSSNRGHQPERFADSAQILASSSCHFFMDRRENPDGSSRIILQGKGRYPSPYPRLVLDSNGVLDYRLAKKSSQSAAKRQTVLERVLDLLESGLPMTAHEIAAKLNLRANLVRASLADLKAEGSIVSGKLPKQRLRYTLAGNAELDA